MYKVVAYIRTEVESEEETLFSTIEEARNEISSLDLIHGNDCIFIIEETWTKISVEEE